MSLFLYLLGAILTYNDPQSIRSSDGMNLSLRLLICFSWPAIAAARAVYLGYKLGKKLLNKKDNL